ncbi:hypothetical protein NLJ89_g5508 [Agrocybe chaxingu]|uniref:Uncharacterized protein n=1 Tax=Agrocybe chaxingu TaxID=84603 RepID=A0A9W8K035_9AGAR|nr:hypothetical protein NLJ89_g5508 [Agrocybe chaxingu]
MPTHPKLVAFEVDNVIWTPPLDDKKFGNEGWVRGDLRENFELVNPRMLRDVKNHANQIWMSNDIPKIIHDLLLNNVPIAIVSRNANKDLCDRALWHFKAQNADNEWKPIIGYVVYDEIFSGTASILQLPCWKHLLFSGISLLAARKTIHFNNIYGYAKGSIAYSDMLFFDTFSLDDVYRDLGVTTYLPSNFDNGLSWNDYNAGLDLWRRNTGN